jgi:hypothetical protein
VRRAGQVKAARRAILAGAGARLGASLQHNSPHNSTGRGWPGNRVRWQVKVGAKTTELNLQFLCVCVWGEGLRWVVINATGVGEAVVIG